MNALVPVAQTNAEVYRASTDAASLCREIVLSTAMEIQKRKYVKVEGWQAIAIAHGCTASSRDVERVEGGVRAIGEVRRMTDGALIAQAEGFVGEDEPDWFGGTARRWKWGQKKGEKIWYDETVAKRPDYAIRAMAQTRAISRACRSAFAHVVVLIDANLSTTPAEEVPSAGFHDAPHEAEFSDVSAGCLLACDLMKASKTPEELKSFWEGNKATLRTELTTAEYAQCVGVMKAEAARLAPAPTKKEAEEVFS